MGRIVKVLDEMIYLDKRTRSLDSGEMPYLLPEFRQMFYAPLA